MAKRDFEGILKVHRRIRELSKGLEHTFETVNGEFPAELREEVSGSLVELGALLKAHFADEEREEGFFECASATHAVREERVAGLVREHRQIAAMLEALHLELPDSTTDEATVQRLRAKAAFFFAKLARHETEETVLLYEAAIDPKNDAWP